MILRIVLTLVLVIQTVSCSVFNEQLYQDVLDPEECQRQLQFLANDTLGLQFLDASGKIPSGIMSYNIMDLGDYFQCLDIHKEVADLEMDIHGKYCTISIPFQQNFTQSYFSRNLFTEHLDDLKKYKKLRNHVLDVVGVRIEDELSHQDFIQGGESPAENKMIMAVNRVIGLTIALCIPKVCTTTEVLAYVVNRVNITYTENYCRLPNDKPFVVGDYVAIIIFSLIAVLTILSTGYDLTHKFVWKESPSEANVLLRSFSVYTNTQRLVTVRPTAGALDCIDGIRAISMLWVIMGHTFVLTLAAPLHNLKYGLKWIQQYSSMWLIAAPITVDTFFLLSGVLCVYATISKLSQNDFIKGIPLFYLHRILRMFPLLATMVLLQASLFNHFADGPYWGMMANATQACRDNWWVALLYGQNYLGKGSAICLSQTWYLSVDMQLYLVCPLVLVWLFKSQRVAWLALAAAVIASLISSTSVSFTRNYQSSFLNFNRYREVSDYTKKYYMGTLARAPPFFVGMVFGYLLHIWRDKKIRIHKTSNYLLWFLSFLIMSLIVYVHSAVIQTDYENQALDNVLNAYMRVVWAVAVGWIIFACVQGYGGPINWFLSLRVWKVPARISYAMYLIHFSVIIVGCSTNVKTHYFGTREALYRFTADLSITVLLAFLLCITIDAPASVLQKMLLQRGQKKKTESLKPREAVA